MKTAPFTPEEVANLQAYQNAGIFHPFTCGNEKCRADLVPTTNGWICPRDGCGYTQNWAHEFMMDGSATRQKELWDAAIAQAEAEAGQDPAD